MKTCLSRCAALCAGGRLVLMLLFLAARPPMLPAADQALQSVHITALGLNAEGDRVFRLSWLAVGGARYRVQWRPNFDVGNPWVTMEAITPAVSGTTAVDVAVDPTTAEGQQGFFRVMLPEPAIFQLQPYVVSTGGGTFYIVGQCFVASDTVWIDGVMVGGVTFLNHTTLQVAANALAAGYHDVEIRDGGGATVAKLEDGLLVTGNGRTDEVPPATPRTNRIKTPGGEVTVHLPDDSAAGGGISGTVVTEPTGEVVRKSGDLKVPGRGPAFFWGRTYRSKAGPSTAQGEGWDFSYNIRAVESGVDVIVHDGEGRADTFFRQADGSFTAPEFFRQGALSGTVFTLTFADKTRWRFRAFDGSPAQGKIDRITDRNGNHLDFAYDGAGRLITINDTLGKNYTVAYNGAGRIASVADFTGRAVTYGYNPAGDLASVTSPPVIGTPTGNDFPAGKTTTFSYSSGFADARLNHNLLTVTDPLGQLVLQNTYAATLNPADFDFDRCVTQVFGGALAETVTFTYLPQTPAPANRFATTKTIRNDRGNVSEVLSNAHNCPLEVREFSGRSPLAVFVTETQNRPAGQLRAGDPAFFVTAMDWNADSQPTSVTLPRGGVVVNTYEDDLNPGGPARERGNLRVQSAHAAPGVPSDFAVLTERWDHLPGFGSGEMIACSWPPDWLWRPPPKLPRGGVFDDDPWQLPLPPLPPETEAEADERRRKTTAAQIQRDKERSERMRKLKEDPWALGRKPKPAQPPPQPPPPGSSKGSMGPSSGFGFPISHTDRRGNVTTCAYDLNGNLLSIAPPIAGTEHTFTCNAFGQPVSHVWPANADGHVRTDTFTYHPGGPQIGWLQNVVVDSGGLGLTTLLEYNDVGVVTSVIDPRGADTQFIINELDQPVRIVSREAAPGIRYETDLRYDANDNLVSCDVQNIDETGALVVANPYFTTEFQFDVLNRCVRVEREVDAANSVVEETVIDANNHVVTRRSGEAVNGAQPANTERVTLDERGQIFQSTHALGTPEQCTTQSDFDLDGNLARVSYGLELVPRTWLLQWDGIVWPAPTPVVHWWHLPENGVIYVEGDVVISGVLDGQLTRVAAKAPGAATGGRIYIDHPISYEPEDPILDLIGGVGLDSITDSMGNTVTFTHDPNGNPIVTRVDGEHTDVPGSASNVRMGESRFVFDANNRCTSYTGLLLNAGGAQIGSVTSGVTFAPNSQPASCTDERGNVTLFGYDTANRPALITDAKTNTRAFTRDANGNVLTITDTDKSDLGNPAQVFVMTREFDGLDRWTRAFDNVNNTTLCAYDSRGNAVLVTDPRNIQTRHSFDGLSRPTGTARDMNANGASFSDPADITTLCAYDDNSRVTAATDPIGNVTTWAYDAFDRPITTTFADTTIHAQGWNIFGDLTQTADANGTVVTNTHDALGRLIGKNIAPGAGVANTTTSETFIYDGRSRLKSATNNGAFGGTTTTFTHDALSRPLSETRDGQTTARTFDAAGNMTSLTYPGGRVEVRSHDSLNRVLTIADGGGMLLTNFFIGPDRIERRVHGNGTQTNYAYGGYLGAPMMPGNFAWRQVTGKFVTGPGGNLDARQFHYDRAQNKTVFIDLLTGIATNYVYNPANWLVNTVVQQGPMMLRNSTYNFNKAGSRQSVAGPGTPNQGNYTQNPTLPNPGDSQRNQYTTAPTGALGYDANGNRVNHGAPTNRAFTFDYANRLVGIINTGTGQPLAQYSHNALGERVQKIVNPAAPMPIVTDFFFSGGSLIEERDPGAGTTITNTWLGSLPIVRIAPGIVAFHHCDNLASTLLLTNAGGGASERVRYQDYGFPEFSTGGGVPLPASAVGNPNLFAGMRFDSESGLYQKPMLPLVGRAGAHICSIEEIYRSGLGGSLRSGGGAGMPDGAWVYMPGWNSPRTFDPLTGAWLQHDPAGDWNSPSSYGNGTSSGNNAATIGIP